jgi:hypothetical protein
MTTTLQNVILVCFFEAVSHRAFSQNNNCRAIFKSVEINATYTDGNDGFRRFLERNLTFDSCLNENYPSHLFITLLIDKNGVVQEVQLKNENLDTGCEKTLKQIFLKMPKWKPARINGKPVCSYVTQNI